MGTPPNPADFDARPPEALAQYGAHIRRVTAGYDLVFDLILAVLNGLGIPDLSLLVVGAGGGQEIDSFAPGNPGWRLTGVDPSARMLAVAREKAGRLGVDDRVEFVRGTVDDLPPAARYDAATCLLVLHLLPDDGAKLALLRGIAARLRPRAPLLLADGVADHVDALLPAWRQYAAARGMPPERFDAYIGPQLTGARTVVSEEREVALLREAGFARVTRFFTGLVHNGWIAHRS